MSTFAVYEPLKIHEIDNSGVSESTVCRSGEFSGHLAFKTIDRLKPLSISYRYRNIFHIFLPIYLPLNSKRKCIQNGFGTSTLYLWYFEITSLALAQTVLRHVFTASCMQYFLIYLMLQYRITDNTIMWIRPQCHPQRPYLVFLLSIYEQVSFNFKIESIDKSNDEVSC